MFYFHRQRLVICCYNPWKLTEGFLKAAYYALPGIGRRFGVIHGTLVVHKGVLGAGEMIVSCSTPAESIKSARRRATSGETPWSLTRQQIYSTGTRTRRASSRVISGPPP